MIRLNLMLCFALLLLAGCTIPTYTYLRNLSDKHVHVVLQYDTLMEETKILYGKANAELRYDDYKTFTNAIEINPSENKTFSFDLAPGEAAFMDNEINHKSRFSSVQVDGKELILTGHYNMQQVKHTGAGKGRMLVWYDVERK